MRITFKPMRNCECGSNRIEGFHNPSYYDMYTIRCYGCEKEWDYPTKAEAMKAWKPKEAQE